MQVTVNITDKNIKGATRSYTNDPIARALKDQYPNATMISVSPTIVFMSGVEANQWFANLPVEAQRIIQTFDLPPRKGGGRKGVKPTSFDLNFTLAVDTKMRAVRKYINNGR